MLQEYQIGEADKFLNTVAARAIATAVFEQGKLAYFYHSGRAEISIFGYRQVRKEEALADYPAYIQDAFPSEVSLFCTAGYCLPRFHTLPQAN